MSRRTLALVPLLLVLASPATAQEEEDDSSAPGEGRRVTYQSVTHIDIEDVDINAIVVGPELQLLPERVRGRFNPLIRLRTDFDDAMNGSVDEVR